MRVSIRVAVIAGCVLLVGCSAAPALPVTSAVSPSSVGPSATPPVGSPFGAPSVAGSPRPSSAATSTGIGGFTVGGDRPVTIQVPPGLDPQKPAPLLMFLHGFGIPSSEHEAFQALAQVAAARGVLYLQPVGTVNPQGDSFWNATDACCDIGHSGVDDSSYLAGLIEAIRARVAVDPRRIFVVGHSNGGFMSYRMACDHSDVIAAIVSLAGASFADRADCQPSEPVAILEIHGSDDDVVDVVGGSLSGLLGPGDDTLADFPPTHGSLAAWATYDGCTSQLPPRPAALDLDPDLRIATGANETTVTVSAGCAPGGHVELWMLEGGGHDPSVSPALVTALIDFLLAHPKPA